MCCDGFIRGTWRFYVIRGESRADEKSVVGAPTRDVDRTEKDRFPLNRYLSFLRSSESINRVKKIDL